MHQQAQTTTNLHNTVQRISTINARFNNEAYFKINKTNFKSSLLPLTGTDMINCSF